MGLDDAWAAFSLLAAVVLLVGAWLRSDVDLPLDERVRGYFMLVSCFTCVLWSALPPSATIDVHKKEFAGPPA